MGGCLKFIGALVVLAVGLVVLVIWLGVKASGPVAPASTQPTSRPADPMIEIRAKAKTFSADQLVAFYKSNEIAADTSLKGKWFIVEGKISSIGKTLGQRYVTLESRDPVRSVQCFFR